MRLRTRFLLVLGGLSVAMIMAAVLSARWVLTYAAMQADEERARVLLERGKAIIAEEISALVGKVSDWASWDEAYTFMTDRDPHFLQVNLVESTFDNLRLDAILLYDTNRQFVAGVSYDVDGERLEALSPDIQGIIERAGKPFGQASQDRLAGFAAGDEYLWLLAIAPILTSQDEGPALGALIMARRMDEDAKARLGRLIAPSLRLVPANRLAIPGKDQMETHGLDSLQARAHIADIFDGGHIVMEVAVPRMAFGQMAGSLAYLVAWILASGAGVWLLAAWLLERWVLRDVSESVDALRAGLTPTATCDGNRPALKKARNDEIGELIDAVESAIGAIEDAAREADRRRAEAIQSQRLAALGTLAVGVAHEINNPNTVISLNMNVLRRELGRLLATIRTDSPAIPGEGETDVRIRIEKDLDDVITETLTASERIAGIVLSLKSFSRPTARAEMETVALPDLIQEAAHWLRHVFNQAHCGLETAFDQDLPKVPVHRQQLVQVFINLLQNACQAAQRPDAVVQVSGKHAREDGEITIAIADNGTGMPPVDLEQALDPFFTTRRSQGGTGLGLSISAAIVRAHGGRLGIVSRPGVGTIVTVVLPINEEGYGDRRV